MVTFTTTRHLEDGSDVTEIQLPPGTVMSTRRKGDVELVRIIKNGERVDGLIVNGETLLERVVGDVPEDWRQAPKKKPAGS